MPRLEAALRRALGGVVVTFGLMHLLPVAFVWLSSAGPRPVAVGAAAWSVFFYVHFIVLTVAGFALQAVAAARARLFYGGPMIDFLLVVTAFMLVETACAYALRRGAGPSWPALLPGLGLTAAGLRLGGGRPLLGS